MVSLDDKVRALAVTAGWKTPRPGQDGTAHTAFGWRMALT